MALRQEAGISCEVFAEYIGVSQATLWRWENGQTKPHPIQRKAYARALNELRAALDGQT